MFTKFWHLIGGDRARFFPEAASSFAGTTDRLMLYLMVVSVIATAGILIVLAFFILKYRRRAGNEIACEVKVSYPLEITWTIVPFALIFVAFFWGARDYLDMFTPRTSAENIFVVGKQWMWKVEHQNGAREINRIHVPIGQEMNLLMVSQDVIHSFFIPDFRVKYDVLPGRYTRVWFRAEKLGSFPLLCTQYCGADHSEMIGSIEVLSRDDYDRWIERSQVNLSVTDKPEARGERLYHEHGCASCHDDASRGGQGVGPKLAGRFGLNSENVIREAILQPGRSIASGYPDVMPSFAGQLNEEDLMELIRFLQSEGRGK